MFGRGLQTSADSGTAIEQTMERLPQGTRRLAAELKSPLPVQLLWDVLTDYENLSRFIPNLSSSELIQRQGQTVRLQQVGSQQLLGLRFSAQGVVDRVHRTAKLICLFVTYIDNI